MSSGGEVSVRFTSTEEAALWQSFSKLVNAGKNVGQQLQDTDGKAVKLSSSLAAFAREVQRIPTSGVDVLQAKLEKVRDLLAKKVITPEQASAAEAKFTADEKAPLKTWAEQQARIDTTPLESIRAELAKLDQAVQSQAISEEAAGRVRQRLNARQAAELRRLAEEQRKLDDAVKAGLITQQQAAQIKASPDTAMRDELERQIVATKQADEELQRFAERIKKLDETPAQRLAAQMSRLDQAVRTGKLNQDEYGRAAKRAQDQYQDELRQSEEAQRRVASGSQQAGASVNEFATGMAAKLAGIISVARVAQAVFGEMQQSADAAARSVQSSREGVGALAQFDPAQFAELKTQARELRAAGAADSLDAAAKMLFALRSAGAEKTDVATFAQMSKFGLVSDAAGMARSASALQTALGKDQAGTFADIVGRALVASKYTPATAEQLVQGAAKAGSFARTQGVGAESLLAGTAILSSAKGSAEEGGSRMAALLRQTSLQKQFRGMDLGELVDAIAAKKLPPERLKKLLSDSEAIDAFQILAQQRDQLRTAIADFATQRGRDPIAERLSMAAADPAIAAAARLREAEGRLEVARVPLGVRQTEVATVITREREAIEKSGRAAMMRGLENLGLSTLERASVMAPEKMQRDVLGLPQGTLADIQRTTFRSAVGQTQFAPVLGLEMLSGVLGAKSGAPSRRMASDATDAAMEREQRDLLRSMKDAAEAQRKAAAAIEQAVQPRPRVDRWGPSAQAQHARAAE